MKRNTKKLRLNRETLQLLGDREVRQVHGGSGSACMYDTCDGCTDTSLGCYPVTACFGTCSC